MVDVEAHRIHLGALARRREATHVVRRGRHVAVRLQTSRWIWAIVDCIVSDTERVGAFVDASGRCRSGCVQVDHALPRTEAIETLIAHYGLPAIFLGAGLEGETIAILAGVIAHTGTLEFWSVVLVAALGSLVADQVWFACGRHFRRSRLVQRVSARPFFEKAIKAFQRRPILFTFGFRFIYGLRTVSPIAIGTTQIPTLRFVLINAVAAATWALVFVSAGYWFGHGIETAFGALRSNHHLLVFAVAAPLFVAALAFWTHRRWRTTGS